jgi:hypothetical protein
VFFVNPALQQDCKYTLRKREAGKKARSKKLERKLEARRGVLRGCFLVEGIFSHPGIFLPQQYNPADGAD